MPSAGAGGSTHAGVPGPDDRSGPVDHVQLGDDVGDVVAYSLAAHAQAVATAALSRPAASNASTSCSRSVSWGNGDDAAVRPKWFSIRRDPGAEERLTASDRTDRRDDLVRPGPLERVAVCPGSERGEYVLVVVVHGEDERTRGQPRRPEPATGRRRRAC